MINESFRYTENEMCGLFVEESALYFVLVVGY